MASEPRAGTSLRGKKEGAEAFRVTPFMRLARAHAASVAGNTMVAIALAGTIFFIDPEGARTRVALTLGLTMAPFAVIAPLIGPTLDRLAGGRRWVVVGANAARVVVCLMMMRELDSLALFPLAFLVLVLDKSYHVAKSALVPTTVRSDDELVHANSLLTRLSGVIGVIAAGPAVLATYFFDGPGPLALAAVVFAVGAVFGVQIPSTKVAEGRASEEERHELRSFGILLAGSAMGLMRGVVGFMTFLIAFDLQGYEAPAWQYMVAAGASSAGSFVGSLVAPALRRANVAEERILQGVLATTATAGLAAGYLGGYASAVGLAFAVGVAASCGKLSFEAIVQRDAPDANRGRTFARFETRFQLIWVIGAFIPVATPLPIDLWVGFLVISGIAVFALVSYLAGLRAVAAGQPVRQRNLAKDVGRRIRNSRRTRRALPPGDDPGRDRAAPPEGSAGREPDERPPADHRPPPPHDGRPVTIDPTKLH